MWQFKIEEVGPWDEIHCSEDWEPVGAAPGEHGNVCVVFKRQAPNDREDARGGVTSAADPWEVAASALLGLDASLTDEQRDRMLSAEGVGLADWAARLESLECAAATLDT